MVNLTLFQLKVPVAFTLITSGLDALGRDPEKLIWLKLLIVAALTFQTFVGLAPSVILACPPALLTVTLFAIVLILADSDLNPAKALLKFTKAVLFSTVL